MVLVFLIKETGIVVNSVISALSLCVSAVIPTLFPFFVISGLLVNLGFVTVLGKIFSPVSRVLFKTSGKGAVVFIIGILCGYPTGAKVIADMHKEKSLDKRECERLLAFCNNSGPLFLIGAVGTAMLKNYALGVVLYVIHFLSAVLTGVLFRNFANKKPLDCRNEICICSISDAITKSIENAVKTILNVCGYVVFFAILCAMVKNVFVISLLEVTTGAKTLITQGLSKEITIILLSGIIGFGGICVMLQVQSAVNGTGISLKLYVLGKLIQALFSMIMAFLYVSLFEIEPVFAVLNALDSLSNIPVVIFVSGVFFSLFCLTKKS